MLYCSTRDKNCVRSAHAAILEGIAPDGGLYVPMEIPRVDPTDFLPLDYAGRAARVFSLFLDDYTGAECAAVARDAYGPDGRFEGGSPAPLAKLPGKLYVMELFHGPTLAFKDIALQAMPRLLPLAAQKSGMKEEALILVATSGDTGKAALEGFRDVPGTRIVVFYPKDGVSAAQYLQMATQQGGNTHVVAVEGNFDDCQRGVKALFTDPDFVAEVLRRGRRFSSANSINWGRLLPQITYYFSAWADLVACGEIAPDQALDFVVPTGNFGDILAGEIARQMGLPVNALVCASNVNDVLVDFFRTGVYDSRRPFHKTVSPSMDILVSSNLERLIFLRTGYDDALTARLMAQLAGDGRYDSGAAFAAVAEGFDAGSSDEAETLETIGRVFADTGYLMDPHTAVGFRVWQTRRAGRNTPAVLLSTASPFKFTDAVLRAVGEDASGDMFEQSERLCRLTGLEEPAALSALRGAEIVHHKVCAPGDMGGAVLAILDQNR